MKADDATQRREQATSEPAGLEQAGLEMENFVIHDIIWDAGGTLFDTYPAVTQAFDAALREFGAQIPLERILQLARESTHYAISILAHETGIDADALESAFRRRYNAIGPEAQPPFPGVKEVCATICARGGRNFIVTHRGRDSLNALLAAHGMGAYFSDSITAEDPFPRKPDPTALNALVARHGLTPATTLLIGDRALDLQAGRAAGMRTCLFEAGPDSKAAPEPADLVITSFPTLLKRLSPASDFPRACRANFPL